MDSFIVSYNKLGFLVFLVFCFVGSCQLYTVSEHSTSIKSTPSIAVLPFQDMSSDKSQEYFGDGIAEEILNILANYDGLRVAGRTSSFSFKGKNETIESIGKALDVAHILEGSIRREGDKIRITAQLIKVTDGFHLWSHRYERSFADVFDIQDDVARQIGMTLLKKLVPKESAESNNQSVENSEAYSLFLRAKHIHLNRYFGNYGIEDFKTSEKLFLRAIELDSTYALPYAGLADLYDSHKDALSDPSALKHYDRLKIQLIGKAWQLNPNLPYVNIVRGWVMRNKKVEPNDLDAAYQSFLKGFELNTSNTDGLFALAYLHEDKSLYTDALLLLDKAAEIDPLRTSNFTVKADFLMRIGQYKAAKKVIEDALTVNPNDLYALSQLAMNAVFLKDKKKAKILYQQINDLDSNYLTKSVIDNKLFHLINGDTAKAKQIPTSLLDYRGEDVILNGLIGEESALENSFKQWWTWYQNFKGPRSFDQSSHYLELAQNPLYNLLRDKSWFQEILQTERKKYRKFLEDYPRAETILNRPMPAEQPTTTNMPWPVNSLYQAFLLFFLCLVGVGIYFWKYLLPRKQIPKSLETLEKHPPLAPFLLQLNQVLENNLDRTDFGIPQLCRTMNISRAQLYRKVKELTGISVALYIRSFRLKKAKQLLSNTDLNISEIAYAVGFKDLSYFSRSFSKMYGKPPKETRN